MRSDQWMALWTDTAAACDWSDYLNNMGKWSNQSMAWWKEMQTLVQSNTIPQTWFEAAKAFTEAWDSAIQGWGQTSTPEDRDEQQQAIAELEKERDDAQKQLAAQKKEMANLKRNLTQNKKTVTQQRSELEEKQLQIKDLEQKVEQQAERLLLLEAQAKSASKPAKPATSGQPATATANP